MKACLVVLACVIAVAAGNLSPDQLDCLEATYEAGAEASCLREQIAAGAKYYNDNCKQNATQLENDCFQQGAELYNSCEDSSDDNALLDCMGAGASNLTACIQLIQEETSSTNKREDDFELPPDERCDRGRDGHGNWNHHGEHSFFANLTSDQIHCLLATFKAGLQGSSFSQGVAIAVQYFQANCSATASVAENNCFNQLQIVYTGCASANSTQQLIQCFRNNISSLNACPLSSFLRSHYRDDEYEGELPPEERDEALSQDQLNCLKETNQAVADADGCLKDKLFAGTEYYKDNCEQNATQLENDCFQEGLQLYDDCQYSDDEGAFYNCIITGKNRLTSCIKLIEEQQLSTDKRDDGFELLPDEKRR